MEATNKKIITLELTEKEASKIESLLYDMGIHEDDESKLTHDNKVLYDLRCNFNNALGED